MIKVRLMGTVRDIKWFAKILLRNKRIVVLEFSVPYQIKGSKKNVVYMQRLSELLKKQNIAKKIEGGSYI